MHNQTISNISWFHHPLKETSFFGPLHLPSVGPGNHLRTAERRRLESAHNISAAEAPISRLVLASQHMAVDAPVLPVL